MEQEESEIGIFKQKTQRNVREHEIDPTNHNDVI